MAEDVARRLLKTPARVFSAIAIAAVGAVTASVGVAGPAAFAEPGYPSWDDVQKAKQNEATKKAEVTRINALLDGLQDAAEAASKTALIVAEAYRVAQDDLAEATAREASLTRQAEEARAKSETSKLRAGLIAAHLAKTGSQDLSLNLFLNGNSADDFLHQLGTATKLSEQSEAIYRRANQDQNTARSLAGQASEAQAERERLSAESLARFDEAAATATAAQAAFDEEQRRSNELYEQLAALKDSTAEAERGYRAAVAAQEAADALARAQSAAEAGGGRSPAAGGGPGPSGAPGGSTGPIAGGGSAGTPSAPSVPAPAPAAPVAPAPVPAPAPAPAPSPSAVDTALAFAHAQLGDRYVLGGAGPDVWDCSGLTKASYAAAGVYIGTHSATNQYNTMARQGRLVPFSQVQAGDLVFWGSGGDYYHVALYVGGGRIIEAPNPSAPVRIHSIWSPGDVAPKVGRPTG